MSMPLLAERGVLYAVEPPTADQEFFMPFVRYFDFHRDSDSYLDKNVRVVFPIRNQYILVGEREKNYISAKEVKDMGWSEDGLFRRVATAAYMFWCPQEDYVRLVTVLLHRHNINLQSEISRGLSPHVLPTPIRIQ